MLTVTYNGMCVWKNPGDPTPPGFGHLWTLLALKVGIFFSTLSLVSLPVSLGQLHQSFDHSYDRREHQYPSLHVRILLSVMLGQMSTFV